MKKYTFLLALVVSLHMSGCSALQDNSGNASKPHVDTNLTTEQAIISNLEQAKSSCIELRDFSWQGMDGLGYWDLRETGQACLMFDRIYYQEEPPGLFAENTLWISIYSILPTGEQVEPLLKSLDACLQNAQELYPQAAEISLGEQPQKQVDAILKTALYLAKNLQVTRESQFDEIINSFDMASDKTRELYLEKFRKQATSYIEFLDVVLSCLQQAQRDLQDLIPANEM